ncbi:polysaccharide biosynthesis protein [Thermoanaerobacterium sp. CMT5567-10]|uniref:UDP-N-acetylglucosamine 4,6-dehydratase family protein n=1 Tax=Thermoanaerobacterium sp. CMT5567-10 TaxID=3061989 RepID=UPI0026DF6E10|nr:UDP-N-acetylglucosamine 4,6-dehydratase family protein [Thermoanaerobacterium sp. CMT5567-10]WKV09848.1 polysaccharide biosynthesis protein [Thermoanaerobacterium sp. CMT5567-10]
MFFDKKILIIGGTGTIGQALVRKLLKHNPKVIRIYSRDEYKQFIMQDEFIEHKNLRFLLGDVRDKERLNRAMKGVDIVFDLAAIKHVPAAEYNPFEAVKTNVIGTQNVIECAIENRVERVIFTSSDKAVSPTNTMGATKLLAERLIASADYYKGGDRPIFAGVRFGNVIGSRGSVIPLWIKQIKEKREITITHPDMTRFMMTIDQASSLVLKACELANGGEIFILKMPVIKLGDLADEVIDEVCYKYDINKAEIKKKVVGLRPGEKMYEELMSCKEINESIEYEDMFAIIPVHKLEILNEYQNRPHKNSYSSNDELPLNKEEIKNIIRDII